MPSAITSTDLGSVPSSEAQQPGRIVEQADLSRIDDKAEQQILRLVDSGHTEDKDLEMVSWDHPRHVVDAAPV
jgi:hypothetical protein